MFVLTHQIAGITFRTESDIRFPFLLANRFEQFRVRDTKPDVHHWIRSVDPDSLKLSPLSENEVESLSRCVRHPRESLESPLLRSPVVRTRLRSCLNQSEQIGFELHHSSVLIFDFARLKLEFFYASDLSEVLADCRVGASLFASFMAAFSAAMVHSSGLILSGAAALFLAPDEGGKTTVLEHSPPGTTILCDDQNILKKEGDAVIAYSTPWGLYTNGSKQVKLGGLFLLEQAEHFELIPLKPVDVLEYLWNEHPGRLFLPKILRIRAFEILFDACNQAPAYRMRFPKDYVDWDAIDAAMAE